MNPLLDLIQTLSSAPKTQQDISVLARTAQEFQSPGVQAELKDIKSKAEVVGMIVITLQAISTAAIVGTFLINLNRSRRR